MAEKKPKENNEPRFEVKKRQPKAKEKPNFFQNVRSLNHPLAEILNFNSEPKIAESLDTQKVEDSALKNESSGHPESQIQDTQTINLLDTQIDENLDTQKTASLDTQTNNSPDTQNTTNLDTQTQNTQAPRQDQGRHPDKKDLGTWAPVTKPDAPRKEKKGGAQAPRSDGVVHSKNEDWRKYDQKRSTVRVNLHIDRAIDRKVRQYCMVDAHPKVELREFYERAAMHFLNFLDTQKVGSLGAETPLDDRRLKIMFKSKPFIINLYLRYNSVFNEFSEGSGKKWTARWTPRDDGEASRYNEVSPTIIELGILQTQIQKGIGSSRIQTFKYYTDEIEKILKSGVSDEMLDTILNYHRMIWKNQTGREIDYGFLNENE